MSKELIREAHQMAELLIKQAWADGDVDIAKMLEDLAITLSVCRQDRTNAQRDNQRLAALSACQEVVIEALRASNAQLTNQLAVVTKRVAS